MNHLRQWAIAAEAYAGADDELPREKPPGSPWQVSILNTWQVVSNPTNSDVWYNALAQEANDGRTMIYFNETIERRPEFYGHNLFTCPTSRPDAGAAVLRPQFSLTMNSKLSQNGQVPGKTAPPIPHEPRFSSMRAFPGKPSCPTKATTMAVRTLTPTGFAPGMTVAATSRSSTAT